jgi:hypothetical protein
VNDKASVPKNKDEKKIGLRVSKAHEEGDDLNEDCHTLASRVLADDKHVLLSISLLHILWDRYYASNIDLSTETKKPITDLLTGSYMNCLVQYGVNRGSVLSPIVVDYTPAEPGVSDDQIHNQRVNLIRNKTHDRTILPALATGEQILLY